MTKQVRHYLFAGLVAMSTSVGLVTAYQFFESSNNETYCNNISSKFCKPNPLEITLLTNHENPDIDRMVEFSKLYD